MILFHRVGAQEVVECLDARTGKERWKTSYASNYVDDYGKGNGPRSTPVIAGQRVFTLGAEGQLHCLDLGSGKVLWKRSLLEDYQVLKNFFGVGTSPLLEGDLLLINVGGPQAGIIALASDSGKEIWRATDQLASYSSPVAATIHGTRQVFFFTRDGLVALEPTKGMVLFSKRWRARSVASVNAATPLVVDDHVFLSASYNTGAVWLRVNEDGVTEEWKGDGILSNHYDTSIYSKGHLYGLDGRQETGVRLRCVEVATGKVRWSQDSFGCTSLLLAEGNLIGLIESGELVLFEATPEAYREKARATVLSKPCRAPIALANGLLYGRDDQKLMCWNLKK
jgi:outer membrane protein assembly factor BamB